MEAKKFKDLAAEAKLKELDEADESNWQKYKIKLDQLVDAIDADLRKAMAYFA